MRPYALTVLILTLTPIATAILSPPAEAHCFSRWYYPHPQKCWAGRAQTPRVYRVSQVEQPPAALPKKSSLEWGPPADIPDIPIDPFAPIAPSTPVSPRSLPPEEDARATALTQLRTELNGH